jgi:hypothetical protein
MWNCRGNRNAATTESNVTDTKPCVSGSGGTTSGVFAVVTPDGEWHEQAEMLWFGMTTNDNDAWEQDMPVLLKQHEDCIGLLVDCHI